MNVFDTIKNASSRVSIRCVVIRNPFVSKVLYIGAPTGIPNQLLNQSVSCHLYDNKRERLIIRVHS